MTEQPVFMFLSQLADRMQSGENFLGAARRIRGAGALERAHQETLLKRAAEEIEQAEAIFHRLRAYLVSLHGPEPEHTALAGESSAAAALSAMFERDG